MQRVGILLCLLAGPAFGAPDAATSPDAIRTYVAEHQHAIVDELESLLRLPNDATDRAAIRRNADAIVAAMKRRGLEATLLTLGDDRPPVVFAEHKVPGAKRTLVFYAHYDGQPVTPEDWLDDPWTPTWRDARHDAGGQVVTRDASKPLDPDWRVYARAASDDKAGVLAILAAYDALVATGAQPSVNLKFFFEGEEEQGSPNLREMLEKHRDVLAADAWIICDGPVHASGRKQLVFGVRGDANVDITVYGPKRPLHSGHFGNWAPNPGWRLAALLASMKDDAGRVTIDGWYDDVVPLGEAERAAIAAAPKSDDTLRGELALGSVDTLAPTLMEAINQPSLNVNGIRAADVHEKARNVIPTIAAATLDLRLVKGNTPERQFARLVEHVEEQGWLVLDREPTDDERRAHPKVAKIVLLPGAYAASRTPTDSKIALAVAAALDGVTTEPVVKMPTLGGSLPLVVINEVLGAETITVPIANPDNNQHAENENLRIGHLWDGIEMLAAVMRASIPD